MPNKSRRVAAKQAELGIKKRRSTRKPSVPTITASDNNVPHSIANDEKSNAKIVQPSIFSKKDTPTLISQSSRNITDTATANVTNPYILGEMKRIGIITILIITILTLLTFTLR
jgi:hypothetical protein